MTPRRKKLAHRRRVVFVVVAGGLFLAAFILARRAEPYIREQAIQYLRERFDSDVELARLQVHIPPASPLRLLFTGGRGTLARVEGTDLVLRQHGRSDVPPLFTIKHFSFKVDLGALLDTPKTVNQVTLDGLEIQIPPKGDRTSLGSHEHARPEGVARGKDRVRRCGDRGSPHTECSS